MYVYHFFKSLIKMVRRAAPYLCPLNTKTTTLSAKLKPVKSSDCILCITLILHVDEGKAYNKIVHN